MIVTTENQTGDSITIIAVMPIIIVKFGSLII